VKRRDGNLPNESWGNAISAFQDFSLSGFENAAALDAALRAASGLEFCWALGASEAGESGLEEVTGYMGMEAEAECGLSGRQADFLAELKFL